MSGERTSGPLAGWQAIVVAGGRASRLGGIDKCALESDGSSLVDRAVLAAGSASGVAVVGRGTRPVSVGAGRVGAGHVGAGHVGAAPVHHVDESPRYGGPVSAIAAGLAAFDGAGPNPVGLDRAVVDRAEWTLVLAGDLPEVGSAVPLLFSAFGAGRFPSSVDGVVAADGGGRVQPLLGLYRTVALERALRLLPEVHGAAMRSLLSPLVLAAVTVPDAFCADVDTPEDARRLGFSLPRPDAGVAHVA